MGEFVDRIGNEMGCRHRISCNGPSTSSPQFRTRIGDDSLPFFATLAYNSRMANSTLLSDADILEHVVSPLAGGMVPEAARAILDLKFDGDATKRIRQLLHKNSRGTISAEERITLEKFLRVGKFIDLLQAKARFSLKEAGLSS